MSAPVTPPAAPEESTGTETAPEAETGLGDDLTAALAAAKTAFGSPEGRAEYFGEEDVAEEPGDSPAEPKLPASPPADAAAADPLDVPDPLGAPAAPAEAKEPQLGELVNRLAKLEGMRDENARLVRELEAAKAAPKSAPKADNPIKYLAEQGWTSAQINTWLETGEAPAAPAPKAAAPDMSATEKRLAALEAQLTKAAEAETTRRDEAAVAKRQEELRENEIKPKASKESFPLIHRVHGEEYVAKVFDGMRAEYLSRKDAYDAANKLPTVEFVAAKMERELRDLVARASGAAPTPVLSKAKGGAAASSSNTDDDDGQRLQRAAALAKQFISSEPRDF